MSLKNLLVAFNGSVSSQAALDAALLMQTKHDAHLTGILAHMGDRDRFSSRDWVPQNVRAILQAAIAEKEAEVEARFRDAARQVPGDRVHWITLGGEPDQTVAQYACMFDVTVTGQHGSGADGATDLHPERIALKSGRPVLVVPPVFDPTTIARRIVLAWDGRRAATRALNDAMQILETGVEVDVVSFGEDVRPPLAGIDVVTALQRHGVTARRIRRPVGTRNTGRDLLEYCAEVEAGTLVMGAFEHSVFRDEIFGGTTRHVLENAPIPVLMSH